MAECNDYLGASCSAAASGRVSRFARALHTARVFPPSDLRNTLFHALFSKKCDKQTFSCVSKLSVVCSC